MMLESESMNPGPTFWQAMHMKMAYADPRSMFYLNQDFNPSIKVLNLNRGLKISIKPFKSRTTIYLKNTSIKGFNIP